MRRKFFLFVVLVFYSFVLRWKNPMEGLLMPSIDVTEFHPEQHYTGKAQFVSHLPQRNAECDLPQNVTQEKSSTAAFATAPIFTPFIVAHTPAFMILTYNSCE